VEILFYRLRINRSRPSNSANASTIVVFPELLAPINAVSLPNRIRPDFIPQKCFISSSAIRTEHLRRNNRDALVCAS
jgi:hypothetical protein